MDADTTPGNAEGRGQRRRGRQAYRAATRRGKRKSEARTRKALKWMAPSQSASATVVRSGAYAVPRNTAVPSPARSPLAAAPLARPLAAAVVLDPIDPASRPPAGAPRRRGVGGAEQSADSETEKWGRSCWWWRRAVE